MAEAIPKPAPAMMAILLELFQLLKQRQALLAAAASFLFAVLVRSDSETAD